MVNASCSYVVLVFWAFSESPNERKIRELQRRVNDLEVAKGQSPVALLEAAGEGKGGGDESFLDPIESLDFG